MSDENHTTCPNCNRRDVEIRELRQTLVGLVECVRKLGVSTVHAERAMREENGNSVALTKMRRLIAQANDNLDSVNIDLLLTENKDNDNDGSGTAKSS
jgi:hypothetical protein